MRYLGWILIAVNLMSCESTYDPYQFRWISPWDELNPPVEYKYQGMSIRFDDVPGPAKECFIDSLKFYVDSMSSIYQFKSKKIINELDGWHIVFMRLPKEVQTRIQGKDKTVKAAGFADTDRGLLAALLIMTNKYPFLSSPFYHELGHVYHSAMGIYPDYDHKDLTLWNNISQIQRNYIESIQDDCVEQE